MVPLSFAPFPFAGQEWLLGPARALVWPAEQALLVADLHLEKASWFARTGQMLPPYDSRETLDRLTALVRHTGARRVFCLGDNFHDAHGPARLDAGAADRLTALARLVDWVWITGNHDEKDGAAAGTMLPELTVGGVMLRHEARPGEPLPELSGHFHPRLRVAARGRTVSRPCAVMSERKLILPAFGALTGGLDAAHPALLKAMQPARSITALVPTAARVAHFPLWQAAAA
ncbi:ligase-associated DNA damage response endonuclease PdeM [Novosphingobium pokkalii]|uniref:Ligase-associated DNA damage response endonuclease PdeM n=1 Tax=Novosphingobium pokkalii TaxID=1770194 RepID=A0ABV7V378_9SPHN|nr:ligase-associated DNA damage response endonuclease PdeM [Novosphingobium pokkalii]GHC93180.1 metallophosphatase [Novosphingobium pokkalii]